MKAPRLERVEAGFTYLSEVGDEVSADDQVDQIAEALVLAVLEALGDGVELLGDLVAEREAADHPGPVDPEFVDRDRTDLFGVGQLAVGRAHLELQGPPASLAEEQLDVDALEESIAAALDFFALEGEDGVWLGEVLVERFSQALRLAEKDEVDVLGGAGGAAYTQLDRDPTFQQEEWV